MAKSSEKKTKGAAALEMRPLGELIPYARNARKHSKEQVEQLAQSIRRFGFNAPVLVDGKGVIIAGHGRVLAAQLVGLAEIPVVPLLHMTDAERRAYIIADNRLAELAAWDDEVLAKEIADLEGSIDFNEIGFSDDDIAKILADAEMPDSDAAEPEKPARRAPGRAIIQYNLVFDTVEQQQVWFAFIKRLKAKYQEYETFVARLTQFIKELGDA